MRIGRKCTCGVELHTGNVKNIGRQHAPSRELLLLNCLCCGTTVAIRDKAKKAAADLLKAQNVPLARAHQGRDS